MASAPEQVSPKAHGVDAAGISVWESFQQLPRPGNFLRTHTGAQPAGEKGDGWKKKCAGQTHPGVGRSKGGGSQRLLGGPNGAKKGIAKGTCAQLRKWTAQMMHLNVSAKTFTRMQNTLKFRN